MKKFTLGEAINIILQNKDTEFKSDWFEMYWHEEYGIVILAVPTMNLHIGQDVWSCIFTNKEWVIIEESLSFMEVVRLGGRFRVRNKVANDLIPRENINLTQFLSSLSKNLTVEQARHVLIGGEFYPQQDVDKMSNLLRCCY